MQYEVLGDSVADLAEEYDIAPSRIKHSIAINNWKQTRNIQSADVWKGVENLEDVTDEVIEDAKHKRNVLDLIRSTALDSKYTVLEQSIVNKAIALVRSINLAEDPSDIAAKLKTVADMLIELKATNGRTPAGAGNGANGDRLVVQILNAGLNNDNNQKSALSSHSGGATPSLDGDGVAYQITEAGTG